MKNASIRLAAGILFVGAAVNAFAQPSYPQAPQRPRTSPTSAGTPSVTPSPGGASPAAPGTSSPAAEMPRGPLKMISTDGSNKQSPIRVTELNYYDEGYGAKYNSEVRVSGAVTNTGKKDLKKVTVRLQIVDTNTGGTSTRPSGITPSPAVAARPAGSGPDVIQEWKEIPPGGILKAGQTYRITPAVWRNSLGTVLRARMLVEHEEVLEKDTPKAPGSN